jgi:hypothetical protein
VTVVSRSPPAGRRRQGRSASRLAWLLYAVALVLVGLAAGLWLVVHRPVAGAVGYEYWHEGMVNGLAFATVGTVIAARRPEHPVGWLFLGAGLVPRQATFALLTILPRRRSRVLRFRQAM